MRDLIHRNGPTVQATSLLACALLLLVGCGGRATVKYPSGTSAPGFAFDFDHDQTGKAPGSATVFSGAWQVHPEADAPSAPNALCQTGSAEFPSIQLGAGVFTDLTIAARFKPISGKEDQAGGLLFRVQDAGNYYILRANALEGNVNFYRYVGGQRSEINGGSAQVSAGQWHELRAEVRGRHFRGFLDGHEMVGADDDIFKAGKVGLWTKADSVTCFDDFTVTPA